MWRTPEAGLGECPRTVNLDSKVLSRRDAYPNALGKGSTHENNANRGVALLIASVWTLQVARAEQTENATTNEDRKEESDMSEEKIIMLIKAKIQPQRRAELIQALREYLPLVRAEQGVEAFYVNRSSSLNGPKES